MSGDSGIERTLIEPGRVHIRHIVLDNGANQALRQLTGFSEDVYVLPGSPFAVCPAYGVNGPRGFQSGQFEKREGQEGAFTLTFPNTIGDDGVAHRDRFMILTRSTRVTQQPAPGQHAYTTASGATDLNRENSRNDAYARTLYRPGQEWFEIWREDELLYVGTPTQAQVARDSITLTGYDALWLLKKTRETSVGTWNHAPRDVIEYYSRVWRSVFDTDFSPAAFGKEIDTSTYRQEPFLWQSSARNEYPFSYIRTGSAQSSNPYRPQLLPGGANLTASFTAYDDDAVEFDPDQAWNATYTYTRGFTGTPSMHDAWALEVEFTRSAFEYTEGVSASYLQIGLWNGTTDWAFFRFREDKTTITNIDAVGGFTQNVKVNTAPPGPFTARIEGRGMWLYFFLDGKLVGVSQLNKLEWGALGLLSSRFRVQLVASTNGGDEFAEINRISLRVTDPLCHDKTFFYWADFGAHPWVSATMGDMRIADDILALPAGGLQATYFNESSLAGKTYSGNMVLSPISPVYAQRVEDGIMGSMSGDNAVAGIPPGAQNNTNFSVRYTGSIWLDLENRDYAFVTVGENQRLFIGHTFYDQVLNYSWAFDSTGTWQIGADNLKEGYGYPAESGWYPMVFEGAFIGDNRFGAFQLRYGDVDASWSPLIPVGTSRYYQDTVNHPDILAFVPMDDGYYNGFGASSSTSKAIDFISGEEWTWHTHAAGTKVARDGPFPATNSTRFQQGDSQYVSRAYKAGLHTNEWVIEGWFMPSQAGMGTLRHIYSDYASNKGRRIYIDTDDTVVLQIGRGGTSNAGNTGDTVLPGVWHYFRANLISNSANLIVYNSKYQVPNAMGHFGMSASGYTPQSSGDQVIGANQAESSGFFDGRLGWISIYGVGDNTNHDGVIPGAKYGSNWRYASRTDLDPYVRLSPIGTFNQQIRFDSHYDAIQQVKEAFGNEFGVTPRQFETGGAVGAFPTLGSDGFRDLAKFGAISSQLRLGRDTTIVIDEDDGLPIVNSINAEDVADELIGDGQGLSDPTSDTSLTLIASDLGLDSLNGSGYGPFVMQEADDAGDISSPALLKQRMLNLLALRETAWQDVQMQPTFTRRLAYSFEDGFIDPGTPSEFKWSPGDGVLLRMPTIGIDDVADLDRTGYYWTQLLAPQSTFNAQAFRRILGVQYPFNPDGLGPAAVTFRARPLSFKDTLRRLQRSIVKQKRYYQGQIFQSSGTLAATGAYATDSDSTSRVPLPYDLSKMVKAEFVVLDKADTTTAMGITVNSNATGITFKTIGRIDITPFIVRNNSNDPKALVTVTNASSGVQFRVELLLRDS